MQTAVAPAIGRRSEDVVLAAFLHGVIADLAMDALRAIALSIDLAFEVENLVRPTTEDRMRLHPNATVTLPVSWRSLVTEQLLDARDEP
jgi:hypothetical protein